MSGTGREDVARRLAEICGPGFSRPAGAADEVAGASARWVAAPRTAQGVGEVLQLAADHDLAVVSRGAGSKIDWGVAPSHLDIVLDTGRLAGIGHRPAGGDVVEVGAGTPVRIIQSTLEKSGQRLPIDVRSSDATIGGVVASGEAGPLQLAHGTPGDRLVAVTYVDASGALVRLDTGTAEAVSGADPIRHFYGSQGAFGVLISATLRLQPAPASRIWVSHPVRRVAELSDLVAAILAAKPAAIEVDLPPTGATFDGQPTAGTVVALLEGEQDEVAERLAALAAVNGKETSVATRPPSWWLRYPFQPGEVALAVEVPIAHLMNAILALSDIRGRPVAVRGSAGLGMLYAALPGDLAPEEIERALGVVRGVVDHREGRCRVVAAPPASRPAASHWADPAELSRLRQLKERFDPDRRLAPGRLPGGI